MANYKKPDAAELTSMLKMVVGDDCKGKDDSATMDAGAISFFANYINGDGDLVAWCAVELPTAANLGAALSMIPPGGAEAMVEDKELTPMARDNLYEVMNILSSLLMDDRTPHLKLSTMDEGAPPTLDGGDQSSYALELGKYGSGTLFFGYV